MRSISLIFVLLLLGACAAPVSRTPEVGQVDQQTSAKPVDPAVASAFNQAVENMRNGRKEQEEGGRRARQEARAEKAFEQVLETIDDLVSERGDEDKLWGSMVKQALKRRKPGFNEAYHGFRSFGKILEEMESRGLLKLEHDKKSGGYIIKGIP